MVKSPFRLSSIPAYNVQDAPWSATGDGVTNDRVAIQSCITDAAAAGRRVYVPTGTYHMDRSGSDCLIVPSNVEIYGDGDTSIFEFHDDAVFRGLKIWSKTGVTIHHLKIIGTVTGNTTNVQGISVSDSSSCVFHHLTFDKMYYAMKIDQSVASSFNTGLTIYNITTLGEVSTPFYLSFTKTSTFTDLTLDEEDTGRTPASHHIYIANECDGLTLTNLYLTGGHSQALQIWHDTGTGSQNLVFNNVQFGDVYVACVIGGTTGAVTIDGVTGSSSRYYAGCYWFWIYNSNNVTVDNFQITGTPAASEYLVYSQLGGATNRFRYGNMNNSIYLGSTPKGCLLNGGTVPTYTSVTFDGV